MKVLITGAAGFIGRNVYAYIRATGQEVIGWDVNTPDVGMNIRRVDLMDKTLVAEMMRRDSPEIVIHCAGAASVPRSFLSPQEDYNSNVTGTHNILFALQYIGACNTKVIFLSSAAVYGNPASYPIKEDAEKNPLSPYALHKVLCEDICAYFCRNFNMDIKILRIFSAFGVGLKKQVFWEMYQKIKSTGKLELLGTGEESRDYIYIDDLVRAIGLVTFNAPRNEMIYNIANGEEIEIRCVAETFADVIGLQRDKISFTGIGQIGAPLNWKADISKIQKIGYVKNTTFFDGVEKYVRWLEYNERS